MFLFLVSVGMSLIFGVTRIVNLAHGAFYMVGRLPDGHPGGDAARARAQLLGRPAGGARWAWPPSAVVVEMGLLRRIYHRDPLMQLILTFGLILVIGTLVLLVWGPDNKSVARPEALAGSVRIFGQPLPVLLPAGARPGAAGGHRSLAHLLPDALGHADPRGHRRSRDAGRPRRQRGRRSTPRSSSSGAGWPASAAPCRRPRWPWRSAWTATC